MEILLADDNPEVRSALRLLLEQDPLPFNVMETTDTHELFVSLSESCPLAVLLDWELPGFQNEGALEAMHSYCPDMKIIAMSSRYEARQEAQAAKVDAFVSKAEPAEMVLTALYSLLPSLTTH